MHIDGLDSLRTWLTSNLQNVCDADPDVLTKYILALLKKDKPEAEMKEFCIDQLDVFLQKETHRFVDKLFSAIRDKAYLPADQRPKASTPKIETSSNGDAAAAKPSNSAAAAAESRSVKLSSAGDGGKKRDRERSTENTSSSKATAESSSSSRPSERRVRQSTAADADSTKKDNDGKASSSHRRITVSVTADQADKGGAESTGSRREVREPRVVRRSRSKSRERGGERTGISRRLGVRAPERRVASPAGRRVADGSDARRVLRPRDRTRSRSPRDRRGGDKGSAARDKPIAGVELEEEPPAKPEKRVRCRDYDEKGYCMRGDRCPYDHGPDPVVVDDPEYLPKMISLQTDTSTGAPTTTTSTKPASSMPVNLRAGQNDPTYAGRAPNDMPRNMSVPPPGYNALNPPPPGVDTIYTANSNQASDSGYNPDQPQISETRAQQPGPAPNLMVPPPGYPPIQPVMWSAPPPGFASLPPPSNQPNNMLGKRPYNDGESGGHWYPKRGRGRGGGARGGGRGGYNGGARSDVPDADKSIVIRKIPVVQNTIFLLSKHFSRFGDIKNVQIGYEGDAESALVTYAEPGQAQAAFKSKAPILNNRFIRVFFYGDTEQARPGGAAAAAGDQPPKPKSMPPAPGSTRAVYNQPGALATRNQPQQPAFNKAPVLIPRAMSQESYIALRKRRKLLNQKKAAYLDLYKKKSQMLDKTLGEQKTLFAALDKAKNDNQKKEYFKMIKVIDKQALSLKNELADITKKMKALTAASAAAERAGKPVRTKQQIVKETVDLELEMMSLKQAGKDTDIHEKKLEKLNEELKTAPDESEVSKEEPPESPTSASGAAASRALGQAAKRLLRRSSSSQSRAAQLIPASANLDKRPRNVVVVGFLGTERDALTKHMTQFGELEDFELDRDKEGVPRAIVTYKTRKDAEQAVALAADFEGRSISVQWAAQVTGRQQRNNSQTKTSECENGAAEAAGSSEQTVVPDAARKPSEQMSATELLASIADNDDDENSNLGSSGDDDVLLNDDDLLDDGDDQLPS